MKSTTNYLIPYRKGDKWGYCTIEKKFVVDCKYTNAWQFHEGYALVELNKKYGYVNINGEEIISCIYEEGSQFQDGMAVTKFNNKYGCINIKGEIIIPFEHKKLYYVSNGFLYVNNTVWSDDVYGIDGEIYSYGEPINPEEEGYIYYNGNKCSPLIYKSHEVFHEDIACVEFIRNMSPYTSGFSDIYRNGGFSYINRNGEQIISAIYDFANNFSEGLAVVEIRQLIPVVKNSDGGNVVKQIYEWDYKYANIAYESEKKYYGYIDKTGKQIIPAVYNYAGDFSEGLAWVLICNRELNISKFGYINRYGILAITAIYDWAHSFFNGMAVVKIEGRCGVINKKGEVVIPFNYESITGPCGKLFIVKKYNQLKYLSLPFLEDEKYGLIDLNESEILPFQYEEINFIDDIFKVAQNGKYGFINSEGREIFPCKYSYLGEYCEGLARFELSLLHEDVYIGLDGDLREVSLINKEYKRNYGFIDRNGNEVINCIYDDATDFYDGIARVSFSGREGYIDKNGTQYWED